MKKQPRIHLAHLPTPIEKINAGLDDYQLYVKRDDLSGAELSGNKVRKLEYVIADAQNKGADVLITCGGIQSNHARATAVAAAKVGLKSHLVLLSEAPVKNEGNIIIDKLFGAEITTISTEAFRNNQHEMDKIAEDYAKKGLKAYTIPVGASDAVGNLGYLNAFYEILEDEKKLGINFDTIVCTVGSGGTYAGLWLGNHLTKSGKNIVGINIANDADFFKKRIAKIANQTLLNLGEEATVSEEQINIIDGYVGRGYALSTEEELAFIRENTKQIGILFDPVYTGKAYRGLIDSLKKHPERVTDKKQSHILFIHTGGMFAVFARGDEVIGE